MTDKPKGKVRAHPSDPATHEPSPKEVSALSGGCPLRDEGVDVGMNGETQFPKAEPIYVAVLGAKKWIGKDIATTFSIAWATQRETALGAALDHCNKNHPDFDINVSSVLKIPRERRTKSDLFWSGFFAGMFLFSMLSIAVRVLS